MEKNLHHVLHVVHFGRHDVYGSVYVQALCPACSTFGHLICGCLAGYLWYARIVNIGDDIDLRRVGPFGSNRFDYGENF